MAISYRRATLDDVDVLVEFRLKFLAEHSRSGRVADEGLIAEYLRDYFGEAIAQGVFISWLAERDGEVVGTSGMVVWQIPPNNSVRTGRQGYILNMYTVPEARRQGVCSALLEKMIAEAESLALSRVHLHASEAGEAVYRKRGFAEPSDVELVLNVE
jgi:N-acetylglutamate synthase-like GNAT family acetyltransferase